ncbi:MAG TPA: PEGA domain-containing protein, partial [Candidatus Paceibacterota bacterium]|nr:PEGA domain-containing protein [Candidatus Paceibacterota bacterium]
MLEPLSKTKRGLLLVFFCMLFIVLIPIIFFRSAGFRFGTDGEVVPTGGLYFNLDDRELEVYINGVKEKSKGLLSSGIFVSPLEPKIYSIEVRKEGYTTWLKDIEVFPRKVAEASPFVVPLNATTTEISPRILNEDTGLQTANPAFAAVSELFEEAASSTAATALAL